MNRHKLLFLLFISSFIPFLGTAQEVSVSGPTDSLTVGTLFKFSLTLQNNSEYDKIIFPDSTIFNDDLEFISRQQFRLPNFSDSASYSLQFFANKDIIIPPLPVKLVTGVDTSMFFTEAYPLFFKTVLASENDEFDPLKPNFVFSLLIWPWILGVLLASALAYFIYQKYYKNRPVTEKVVKDIPEFVSPLTQLEERLNSIKEEHTLRAEKDYKLFYSQLGDAVRAYLEDLYGIPALESTTRELSRYMDAFGVDLELIKFTRLILNEADMIKFAKMIPSLDQSWVAYQHAQAFLDRARVYDIQRIARLKERFESQFRQPEIELDQEDSKLMEWANPEWFWALLLLPLIIGFYIYSCFGKRKTTFTFSTLNSAEKLPGNWKVHLHWLTALLSWVAFTLLIVALARPQLTLTTVEKNAEGIDIVMVLDISSSMRAEDLKPNRFEAARGVAKAFVEKRASDRIGLVTFAMKSFTVVPPTLDYNLLNNLLDELKMGVIEDGTAIGMGIATAINRLKDSETKSKIIILLTDGQNNAGEIDPVTAADLAVTYGIKIYTIGAGTRGTAPYPIQDPIFGLRHQNIEVNIDEEMLSSVAKLTGGKYYRATDTNELFKVYEEIDSLEKTKVEELIYTDYEDEYPIYLGLSFAFFLTALVINRFYLRSIVNT